MQRWYVADVMTREVVAVAPDTGCAAIADVLVEHGISAVPVIDGDGRVLGMVGEQDVLARLEYADRVPHHPLSTRWWRTRPVGPAGDTARTLMTAPAVTVGPGETVTRAARRMGAARVKQMAVVDGDGRLVGIVTRQDLVHLYARPDDEIRCSVVDGVIRPLGIDPQAVTVEVRGGVVTLAGALDRRSTAAVAASLAGAVPGVVEVVDRLRYRIDDGDLDPRRSRAEPVRPVPAERPRLRSRAESTPRPASHTAAA